MDSNIFSDLGKESRLAHLYSLPYFVLVTDVVLGQQGVQQTAHKYLIARRKWENSFHSIHQRNQLIDFEDLSYCCHEYFSKLFQRFLFQGFLKDFNSKYLIIYRTNVPPLLWSFQRYINLFCEIFFSKVLSYFPKFCIQIVTFTARRYHFPRSEL